MSQNFNTSPYFDDFDPTKNYYRILFKPGYSVQARELTQSQTILQDQVTKFADNIFKQNSPVTGGQLTTNLNCSYITLNTTYLGSAVDVTKFSGLLITDTTGTISARVIAVQPAFGSNLPTLIVSYLSGSTFTDNSIISATTSVGATISAQVSVSSSTLPSTGNSSVVSIAQGVFYISGNYVSSTGSTIKTGTFVQVNPQTIILNAYDNLPSYRIGLNIVESIQTSSTDASLLDPAIGASNYQAPGADRYQISLILQRKPLTFGDDASFIELARVTNGNVQKLVDGSVYNVIDDYFAKREYETNGDYIVNDFKLTPKANTANNNVYTMSIGKGIAYVRGYRINSQTVTNLTTNRARTTASLTNNPVFIDYGSYFYVDTVRGNNSSFFATTQTQSIDLHCVPLANVNYTSTATYNTTLVAQGYMRGLVYDHNTTDSIANTYIYRAYVYDLQNQTATGNAVSATVNTITLPSTFSPSNNAYSGVYIAINSGTSAGDVKTILSYNGSTKVATVSSNWTVTPDTSSQFSLNFDTKDIQTIASTNGNANINASSKVNGVSTGQTQLQNPITPELIFPIGQQYVSTLSSTSYTTQQEWTGVGFNTGTATLDYTADSSYLNVIQHLGTAGSTLSTSLVKQNYTIVVTSKGTSSYNVGDIVPWVTTGRTVSLDATGQKATFTASDLSTVSFTATVLATVFVKNADSTARILKSKSLVTGNTSLVNTSGTQVNTYTFVDNAVSTSTGQIYIQNAGILVGSKQSLYLSDVKQIVKIIDTGSTGTSPTVGMLTSASNDITNNYSFDNGQRDNYYDHASITLKPGAPKPSGNILVIVNYYQHSGGDGYFSVQSYTNEQYQQIPQYTSKHGVLYNLRDCLDFRPARLNAQTSFVFRYSNSASNYGGLRYCPIKYLEDKSLGDT